MLGVGIIGLGTVGSAVVKYLFEEGRGRFRVKKIGVRDVKKKRSVKVPPELLTSNYLDVINDPDVQVVVEVTGDKELSYSVAMACLKKGKHFITATKETISERGTKLFQEARRKNLYIGYRATIVGLFPILSFIQFAASSGKKIKRVSSVLNGTCNFILDQMKEEGISYQEAVKKAVEKGFAEPDPSSDVSGYDTALKLKIILRLLFGNEVADQLRLVRKYIRGRLALPYTGIEKVSIEDIKFAGDMGYSLKLIGFITGTDSGYSACVAPMLTRTGSIIASLRGPENGIEILDEKGEVSGWFGHGAGPEPTRIAIMQDLESVASGVSTLFPQAGGERIRIVCPENIKTRFFLKLYAYDRPGVLARIGGVLGKCGINIASVMQKESAGGSADFVPVVITTYEVSGDNIMKAEKLIKKLKIVDSRRFSWYRIID